MVDYIKKKKNLPVNQEPHRLQFPATESEWSKCLVSKENQLKVRISSFDSLSEVDILPPCLPLQELHLLAESSFLKTLAELQLLILLEACWGGTTRGLKFSLPGPSRAATILEHFFLIFETTAVFECKFRRENNMLRTGDLKMKWTHFSQWKNAIRLSKIRWGMAEISLFLEEPLKFDLRKRFNLLHYGHLRTRISP